MKTIKMYECEISAPIEKKIQSLLIRSFGSLYPEDRIYFKQVPHQRFFAYEGERLVGQVGIDYRIMNLNGKPIKVLGVIDLCVREECRGKGIATLLLTKVEEYAIEHRLDFLLLFADNENVYRKNGYRSVTNVCRWLKIDDHHLTSVGVGEQVVEGLMIKQIGSTDWEDGVLDFLGYLY